MNGLTKLDVRTPPAADPVETAPRAPSLAPTVIVSVLLLVVGIVPANRGAKAAQRLGFPTRPYQWAFLGGLAAGVCIYLYGIWKIADNAGYSVLGGGKTVKTIVSGIILVALAVVVYTREQLEPPVRIGLLAGLVGIAVVGLLGEYVGGLTGDSASKIWGVVRVIGTFLGILLAIFYAAGRASGKLQRPLAIVVCLGPAVVLLLIGLVIPAIRTIYFSFLDSNGNNGVGFKNYSWAFTNSDNQGTLIRTLLWILIVPFAATGFGLVIALLVDRMKRQSIPKSLIFLPTAISFVGASVIWQYVYAYRDPKQAPQVGLLSAVVRTLGWKHPPNWILSHPLNTFLLMIIMIWIQTGFAMVVLSAAIKAIPDDIIEAARMDGATGMVLFRTVQLPMVRNTLVVVLTTIMIATLKVFDIVRTMTGGNFHTEVLANAMYSQTFVQNQQGRGAALAVIIFLGVSPLVAYNVVQMRRERSIR